ncbi:Highly reducing polyketide synthase pks5 [Pseudocercospora fuligena]|uniref:Highly reducing polyketide synthase pks5 n=1 Tax=Pseudocercospora fuligena TaxID=685502 RepID=A0A8H6RP39_9PEZI|nr:Highly reducing polyketide synthase pks5 [Pseudocercospora fuligena]
MCCKAKSSPVQPSSRLQIIRNTNWNSFQQFYHHKVSINMAEQQQSDCLRNRARERIGGGVAIIGISCRFAGASSPHQLWENISTGKDCWSEIPRSRFAVESLFHPDQERTDRHHIRGGYFIDEDPMAFDAAFFNVSTEAAQAMDPQLRASMEGVYEALEDAGIPLEKLAGTNTSVFSGTFGRDYSDRLIKDPETLPPSFFVGNGAAMYSNRISHFFDLKGPSVTTDTGCSGSMAALHLAAQTIFHGESDMSIVAVAQYMLNHDLLVALSNLGVLGRDGRCYSWDSRAQGYGRGEGMAVVILKRLDYALRDKDHIYSVILETAMNQDGKTSTLTSPSADAQVNLINDCYSKAGLKLSDTPYVEAHMTGTPTGDPIEAEAIARTFGAARAPGHPVYVGSVKPNIGHTEPVSGLAALLKTALMLHNGHIPPHLNFKEPNPSIPLREWNLQLAMSLTPWPRNGFLRASINNFGYGGTNVHAILESAEAHVKRAIVAESEVEEDSQRSAATIKKLGGRYVLVVSSKHQAGVIAMKKQLAEYVHARCEAKPTFRLCDLAYTLGQRRSLWNWTFAVSVANNGELISRLQDQYLEPMKALAQPPRVGFIFTGQGAQWHAMGRELLLCYPVFAASMRRASDILQTTYGASFALYDEFFRDETTTRMDSPDVSQPATVALQLCLVDLLRSWNINPSAVVSHSSGEISAAYAAGVLTAEEAIGVAFCRGLLTSTTTDKDGGMMAVRLGPDEVAEYLSHATKGKVIVACINSPSSITLSGDVAALNQVAQELEDDGISFRKLNVRLAYHSHHMQAFASGYDKELASILPSTPRVSCVPFASPTTGSMIQSSDAAFGSSHWVMNLVSPVLFSAALSAMVEEVKLDVLLEIGPHSTLSGAVRETLRTNAPAYLSCLRRSVDAVETIQQMTCSLLVRGSPVALAEVNSNLYENPKAVSGLPTYVWDHTNTYVHEPRASRENRYRKAPPHELLGSPIPGTVGKMPAWRNFLRLHDLPWLADHQLESQVVFPAAGYISMAIEAVRQVVAVDEKSRTPYRYHLRDVDVANALVVPPDTDGAEVFFTLRECDEKELDHVGWYSFEVSSTRQGAWTQHCVGLVMADWTDPPTMDKASVARQDSARQLSPASSDSGVAEEVEEMFTSMRATGIYHGPAFQNLIKSTGSGNSSLTDFKLSPNAIKDEYIVHPTTIDSVFQTCYFSVPSELRRKSMTVPRSIRDITVSAAVSRYHVLSSKMTLEVTTRHGFILDGAVSHAESPERPVVQVEGFHLQNVPLAQTESELAPRLHSKFRWEMDVLDDLPSCVKESMAIHLNDKQLAYERDLQETAYHTMTQALDDLQEIDNADWQDHHKRYYQWIQDAVNTIREGKLQYSQELNCDSWLSRTPDEIVDLFDLVSNRDAGGELLYKIGSRLSDIIRGAVTPLELMMEDGLLQRYYSTLPLFLNGYTQLRKVVELYASKYPGAKVLEIGAGTGGATLSVFQAFAARAEQSTGTLLGHYDYTDISADFFVTAREKFRAQRSKMTFRKLDIEQDPCAQGFEEAAYDLVIASQVLHATKSLTGTLANVRRLLKRTGKLVFLEGVRHRHDHELIFGTLPGWWLSEDPERQNGAIATVALWDTALKSSGFSGVDFQALDCEEPEANVSSVLVASAVDSPSWPFSIGIIYDSSTSELCLESLTQMIRDNVGFEPFRGLLGDIEIRDDSIYLVAVEMTRSVIGAFDQSDFQRAQALLTNSKGVLWIGRGAGMGNETPLRAAIQGVLRTLRREDHSKRHVLLDLDPNEDVWTTRTVDLVQHVFRQSFDYNNADSMDWEYAVRGPLLFVPRLYPDRALDLACSGVHAAIRSSPWSRAGRDLIYEVPLNAAGFVEDIIFEETKPSITESAVPRNMVEIEPAAFGVNFQDLAIAQGLVDNFSVPTHELAGVVKRLGPGAEQSGLRIGDRVCGAGRGPFASTSRAWWHNLIKIPDDMSYEEGASFAIVYLTAYIGIVHTARLEKGESILIHSAAGGVGQAAIMLAQHLGAEIFATCGSVEKRRFLRERYGIPDDHIFSSRDKSFASGIMEKRAGQGVHVVLNSLAGPLLKATWECVARFGRFIEIGKVDLQAAKRLSLAPFARNITMAGVDLVQYSEFRGQVIQDSLVQLIRLYSEGAIRSVYPVTPFPVSKMKEALQFMQKGIHMGKIVIVVHPQEMLDVKVIPPRLDLPSIRMTHLVVGGLTGIGVTIVSWMIHNGAKHVLAVSRNAEARPSAAILKKEAREHGCSLLVMNCDIVNEVSLQEAIKFVADQGFPAIGGVVQAAMVLEDSVLERMTFAQWQKAVRPKIEGTLNLHNHLENLAYFIMLSSASSVTGNISQANYAAGNAFQDSLARHRTAQGKPALSINLGPVEDVGYVAEQGEKAKELVNQGVTSIMLPIENVLRLIAHGITRPLSDSVDESQIVTCFPSYDRLPKDDNLLEDRRFGTLRLGDAGDEATNDGDTQQESHVESILQQLVHQGQSLPEAESSQLVYRLIVAQVAELFGIGPSEIDAQSPLSAIGMDSLVAVRFRNWLGNSVKARFAVFEILQSPSLLDFTKQVAARSNLVK